MTIVFRRLLKRANLIIEAVREHKLIDNVFQLQKMIVEAEEKEGMYPYKTLTLLESFINCLRSRLK